MARRDYKTEYQRRKARGLARGLSLSQARGHPRAGETHVSPKANDRKADRKLFEGLKALRETRNLGEAARKAKVSPERLRKYVRSLDFVQKRGGRYLVGEDPWGRKVIFYAGGKKIETTVVGYERAKVVGLYWNAVGEFLRTNDPAHLAPYRGVQVTDGGRRSYILETRPNVLYRLSNEGLDSFEKTYRLVAD